MNAFQIHVSLSKAYDTAAGLDEIPYQFLNPLPSSALTSLPNIYSIFRLHVVFFHRGKLLLFLSLKLLSPIQCSAFS